MADGKQPKRRLPLREKQPKKPLSYQERKGLPSSAFVFPDEEAYPIHDEAHARAALQRGSQHESGSRLAQIVRAVMRRYPNIEVNPDLIRLSRRTVGI